MIQTSIGVTTVNSITNNKEVLPGFDTIMYSPNPMNNKRKEPVSSTKRFFSPS